MGAFAKIGLLAFAGTLFSAVDAAFTAKFKLFDANGMELTSTTLIRPGTVNGDPNKNYFLRVYRSDGGPMGDGTNGCRLDDTKITMSTNTAKGTSAFAGTYFQVPLQVGYNAVGDLTATDAGGTLTCDGSPGTASSAGAAVTLAKIATPLTSVALEDAVPNAVGSLLKFDGTAISAFYVFNRATSTALTLTLEYTGIDTPALGWSLSDANGFFTFPKAFTDAGVSITAVSGATSNKAILTITVPTTLLPGVYEFELNDGAITVGGTKIAGFKMRYIHGLHPVIYNANTNKFAVARPTSNSSTVIYATNATQIGLRHYLRSGDAHISATPTAATTKLTTIFSKLQPFSSGNSGFDVSSLLDGFSTNPAIATGATTNPSVDQGTSGPNYANYEYQAALSEGSYKLITAGATISDKASSGTAALNRDIWLIIDRTPPVATNITWSGTAQVVGYTSVTLAVPNTMFSDSISTDPSWLTVVKTRFIGSDGQGYYCPAGTAYSALKCYASTVRGPAGNVILEVTVADEAGNEASAWFTIPIVDPPTVSITVADKRGVPTSTSMVSGGTNSLVGTNMQFTVVATFSDPITTPYPDLTAITGITSGLTGASAVLSSGNRVLTYTAVGAASGIAAGTISFLIAAGQVKRSSDSVLSVAASNTVSVVIDKTAPTAYAFASATTDRTYVAGVNTPFFQYIPMNAFADAVSTPDNIKITSATTTENVGLSVTLGPLGRAYISGTATSAPTVRDAGCYGTTSAAWVKFTLKAEDEAGNEISNTYCVEVVSPAITASLSINRNTLNFAESATGKALDSVASMTSSGNFYRVYAYLETPEDLATVNSKDEKLDLTASAVTPAVTKTAFAKVTNGAKTADKLGVVTFDKNAGANDISASVAATVLQTLTYANAKDKLTPGFRTVRFVVVHLATQEVVVAVSSKTVYVTNVNTQPDFTVTGTIAVAWTEGDDFFKYGAPLFRNGAYLSAVTTSSPDADDSYPALASVSIATTGITGSYGACDSARDYLYLPTQYTWDTPKVYGSWNPSTCTLTLKSLPSALPSAQATYDHFREALHAVLYRNSDRYDPTNGDFGATSTKRRFSLTITDKAAEGKAAAPLTSDAEVGDSAPALTDDEPIVIWENLYGPGGIAYSLNQTGGYKYYKPAFLGTTGKNPQLDGTKLIPVRKFTLDYDFTASSTTVSNTLVFKLDFSKIASRSFGAKAAFYDYDTPDYVASFDPSLASKVALSFVNSAGADFNPTALTFASSLSVGADLTATGNSWSASTSVATVTVSIKQGFAAADLGEYGLKVRFGPATGSGTTQSPFFIIWFDIRQKACYLDSAGFLTTAAITDSTTLIAAAKKYINDPNTCFKTFSAKYAATVSASVGSVTGAPYYKLGTTVMVPGDGTDGGKDIDGTSNTLKLYAVSAGAVASSYLNFFKLNETLSRLRHDLVRAGVSDVDAMAASAPLRSAARGMASFYFEKDSFATTSGTFDFKFVPMGQYQVNTLPAGNPGEILDANMVFELTPACMKFVYPVRACALVGDTPAGYTRSIKVSSQRDCTDSTKGWTAWESLSGVTFDAVTGLICGNTTHFSALATFLTPLGSNPTVSKAISMGGSCPNDCSGHGYCRSNGKCACFSGFNGNDCSARTCPVAESWDGGNFAVHQLKECAERGVCNTKTGQCACYPGFEGSACQRTACPNACSGHGQCKLLKDLPKVQATGYSKWEVDRLQKCVCDAGYTGLDCSERICPFGDDPETTCNDKRQIQQVKLDFGSLPGDANAYGLFDTDELALTFRSYFGQNLSVPRIVNVFASDGSGATNFARSLKSLPGFAVSDVSVSASIASDFTSATYNVTFDGTSLAVALAGSASARLTATGNTVSGNQALLICPTNSYGSLGCQAAGCRPKYKQARVLSQPTSGVRVSSTAILRQPDAITAGSNVGKWGVSVTVIIANRAETGEQTYNVTSKIYERDDGMGVAETPLPPAGSKLRSGVTLPYGLEVDFDAGTLTPGTYEFKWRLPTCSVTQVQSASAELELAECSRRGNCDRATGTCKCFPGYSGGSCGAQTVVV